MLQFNVFISSVQKEFAEERKALFQHFKTDALLSAFFIPILFEKLPAAGRAPNKVYRDEVGKSEIYLGLLGADYGYEDSKGISPTEHEYMHATALKKERWIFIMGGLELKRHKKEKAFIGKVGKDVSRKRFYSIEELKQEVNKASVAFLQHKELITFKSFDESLHPTASIKDLDRDKIQNFISLARAKRNFPLKQNTTMDKVLTHLNMLHENRLTNSSLLVFGKKPQQFFPTAIVKCAHFHGFHVQKPIPDHKIFKGDVFEQVDQAVDFVLSKINVSVGTRDKSIQAPIHYELPRGAVTEAIVNAVAHRDYTSNGSVQVMLFADRLEISNPGRLAPELTLAKLKTRHASYPTNPLLAECLYQAGYIERFGTGTLEIIRLSKEEHLNAPDFSIDEGFKVVLWRPSADSKKIPTKYRPSNRPSTDQVTDQVEELVKRLLLVISKPLSRPELMTLLDLRHNANFRDNYLRPAMKAGFIEMTDPDSPNSPKQRYRLTEKGQSIKKGLKNRAL